jgi:hypothetical protein
MGFEPCILNKIIHHASFQLVFETGCFQITKKLGPFFRLKTETKPTFETDSEYEHWVMSNSQSTETKHHAPPSKIT